MVSRETNKHLILYIQMIPVMSLLLYTCAAFPTQSNPVRLAVQRTARSTYCSFSTHAILRRRTYRFHGSCSHRSRQQTVAFSTKLSCTEEQDINAKTRASKWAFLPRKKEDGTSNESKLIENILVCGDGDLSFSADIASELESLNITLFATVLEDEMTHNQGTNDTNAIPFNETLLL
jgi:hypothetical protein